MPLDFFDGENNPADHVLVVVFNEARAWDEDIYADVSEKYQTTVLPIQIGDVEEVKNTHSWLPLINKSNREIHNAIIVVLNNEDKDTCRAYIQIQREKMNRRQEVKFYKTFSF